MISPDLSDTARGGIRTTCIYGFIALMFLLSLANIPLPGSGIVRPAFLLIAIYFWTITRPYLLPVPAVFMIGLAFDIVSGSIVGLHTFAFMLIVLLIRNQGRYLMGQAWPVLWLGFAVAAFILVLIEALVYSIAGGALMSVWLVLANVLINVLAYPLIAPLMMRINRLFLSIKHDYS